MSTSLSSVARQWPWRTSLIAAALVVLAIGTGRHWDFGGIEGFSTTNYGWLVFSLVGGMGLAWRLAKSPAGRRTPLRPLGAACSAFVVCFIGVTIMGLVFIPGQPLGETLTTDAPGRALPVAMLVAATGYASEILRAVARLERR